MIITPRIGFGKSKHRFLSQDSTKPCVIAGIIFDDVPGFQSKSDGDVVFYALCNAISSLIGVQIIEGIAADLCLKEGITDSEIYLKEAVTLLKSLLPHHTIAHVAIALEAKRPEFHQYLIQMQANIARILGIASDSIGITAITGDGLSDVGCGEGVSCQAILTVISVDIS